jgi:hypothetical protein
MKTDLQYSLIAFVFTMLLIIATRSCNGATGNPLKEVFRIHEIELVWPGSFKSMHNENPGSARQNNGGFGFRWGMFGYISLTNSYSDPGEIYYLELVKAGQTIGPVNINVAVWLMEIRGYQEEERTDQWYTDANGEARTVSDYKATVQHPPPWPRFQIGIDPTWFFFSNNGLKNVHFQINYNKIYFPVVAVNWWSIGIKYDF